MNKEVERTFIDICDAKIDVFYFCNGITCTNDYESIEEIHLNICENVWFKYFWKLYTLNDSTLGENWIDFEKEIGIIVQAIDKNINDTAFNVNDLFENMIGANSEENTNRIKVFKEVLYDIGFNKSIFELCDYLYNNLNKLIFALEIYLYNFVDKIEISLKSPDIDIIKPNYVINFNYTNTYQKLYKTSSYEECHIHGVCKDRSHKNVNEYNNMVLGCGEYFIDENHDFNTNDYTMFQKYIQRAQKETAENNYKFLDIIKNDYNKNNELTQIFIFGHSLGEIDKDILYDYINDNSTVVTIFCKDQDTKSNYMKRIVSITGKKRLHDMITVHPRKLNFLIQQDMIPIKKLSISGAAP